MENKKLDDVQFVKYKKCLLPHNTEWDSIYIQDGISINYHSTGDSENDNKLLAFKYVNANRTLKDIKEGKFTFVSPSLWRDPFEQLYYDDIKPIGDKFYSVKCCCLALNSFENEEGFWHFAPFSSPDKDNPSVRVSIDMIALYNSLQVYANKHNSYTFYVGLVKYVATKELLQNKSTFGNIDDYISSLLLKREAFKHEMELRIFAVEEVRSKEKEEELLLKIGVSKDVYNEIVLPPCEPMIGNNHLCGTCYTQILESSYSELKKDFEEESVKVKFSRLYDISYFKNKYKI